mmetsp:Transcript_14681/g.33380  ORF Transcript_14681/g.33380 Transcript_14681/m.33380 type:complete len:216 (-) Transcript_14681:1-648(-)
MDGILFSSMLFMYYAALTHLETAVTSSCSGEFLRSSSPSCTPSSLLSSTSTSSSRPDLVRASHHKYTTQLHATTTTTYFDGLSTVPHWTDQPVSSLCTTAYRADANSNHDHTDTATSSSSSHVSTSPCSNLNNNNSQQQQRPQPPHNYTYIDTTLTVVTLPRVLHPLLRRHQHQLQHQAAPRGLHRHQQHKYIIPYIGAVAVHPDRHPRGETTMP